LNQLAISFVNSYDSSAHQGDPKYFIKDAIPSYTRFYGLLVGPAFTIPYAVPLLFTVKFYFSLIE